MTNARDPGIAPLSTDFTFPGGNAGPGVHLRRRDVTAASADVDVTVKLFDNHTTRRTVIVRTVLTDAGGTIVAGRSSARQTVAATSGRNLTRSLGLTDPRC